MAYNPKHFLSPNDPILIEKAKLVPIGDIKSKQIKRVIEKLIIVACGEQGSLDKPILVGLAAPQVGISKRIILVDTGADGRGKVSGLKVYINPEIVSYSKTKEKWYEACFSTSRVCGIVERPKSITVAAYDTNGNKIKEKHSGYVARIFQHEIDHLNGTEFVTHINNDENLHWVEEDEFPKYRNNEGWRNWKNKCPRKKWEKIKGIG